MKFGFNVQNTLDRIEFACFSFRVSLLVYQLFVFQTGHRKYREFWRCIKQMRQIWRGAVS